MFFKVKKAYRIVINTFGVLGAIGFIWYGITNAKSFGLTTIVLGEEKGHFVQNIIDSSINFIQDVFPYIAFFSGILILLFIIIVPIISYILKRRGKLENKYESAEVIASKISELSKQLEENLKTGRN